MLSTVMGGRAKSGGIMDERWQKYAKHGILETMKEREYDQLRVTEGCEGQGFPTVSPLL